MKSNTETLVILAPAFPDDGPATNWVLSHQLLVKALKKNFPGIRIIVLAFFHPGHTSPYTWNGAQVIPFNGIAQRKIRRVFLWRHIWRELKKIRRENRVIGLFSLWCGETALIGKYFGQRYAIPHRCWICGQDARKENKWVKFIRPRSEELVAMSAALVETFHKNHGVKPGQIIPNAIDEESFPAPPVTGRDIDILGAGSLLPLKKYDLLVAAVASLQTELPTIRAALCGEGGELANLQAQAGKLGLGEALQFLGARPHREVLQLMQRTKVFLHPSAYEGFSTVCLEALYAGAHVISFCDPVNQDALQWHIVQTPEQMAAKALEILRSADTEYAPALLYSMEDTARAVMGLFSGQQQVIRQNISYHDQAADSYNKVMAGDPANKDVRQRVKEKFIGLLPPGRVLDFGGGTGLDLDWLTQEGHTVIFCEPSPAMREKAIDHNKRDLENKDIVFLEGDRTDFSTWRKEPPFPQKMDAILSNFGPLNYIPDIGLLFNNLAAVIKPGGHFVLLVLDFSFSRRFRWHRRNAVRSLIFGRPFLFYIPYEGGQRQTIFVHTLKEIRKAAAPFFNYSSHESIPGFGFMIVHLTRNEK